MKIKDTRVNVICARGACEGAEMIRSCACLLIFAAAVTAPTLSAAQRSEEECKQKYLIEAQPKDWKKYNVCLTKIIQCKDCGTEKPKSQTK